MAPETFLEKIFLQGLTADAFPNEAKCAGKFIRPIFHPSSDVRRREPVAGFDFLSLKLEGAFGFAAINPNVFLIRFRAGGDFEKASERSDRRPTEFFFQLPDCAGVVMLAGIKVAGGGGIPLAGLAIFFQGPLLEKNLTL